MAILEGMGGFLEFTIIGYENWQKDWIEYEAQIIVNDIVVFPINHSLYTMYKDDIKCLFVFLQSVINGKNIDRWFSTEMDTIGFMSFRNPELNENIYEIWLLENKFAWGFRGACILAEKPKLESFFKEIQLEAKNKLNQE